MYGSGAPPITIPSFIPTSTTLEFILVYALSDAQRAKYLPELTELLGSRALQHVVAERFALERIAEAHEAVEAGAFGNVVVDLSA